MKRCLESKLHRSGLTCSLVQDFLEGQGDFDGIGDMDGSASGGSPEEDELMSFASSGGIDEDTELDEQSIWKEMQRILKLEDASHSTSDNSDDDLLDVDKDFGDDEDIHSASGGNNPCPAVSL